MGPLPSSQCGMYTAMLYMGIILVYLTVAGAPYHQHSMMALYGARLPLCVQSPCLRRASCKERLPHCHPCRHSSLLRRGMVPHDHPPAEPKSHGVEVPQSPGKSMAQRAPSQAHRIHRGATLA